jgi:hypothetical protein
MFIGEAEPLGTDAKEPGCEQTRKDDQGRLHPSSQPLAGTGRSCRAKSCKAHQKVVVPEMSVVVVWQHGRHDDHDYHQPEARWKPKQITA